MASAGALFAVLFLTNVTVVAQENQLETDQDKITVMAILSAQVAAWNAGDLEAFMKGYWNSPGLTFSAGGTTTRGWQATLDRYKAKYDTKEKMGTLRFGNLEFQKLSDEVCLVLGTWHLEISSGNAEGNTSIVFKKIDEHWKIVHDHSSTLEKK